jgi:hypothetical protein
VLEEGFTTMSLFTLDHLDADLLAQDRHPQGR